jgi:cytochrome P450
VASDVYYDPYDLDIYADPWPTFARLREEAPLYRNEEHGFYALSRFEDVEKGLVDHRTFISSRGVILEMIKANITFPRGVFIMEDPPLHTAHRGVLSRVFTPKRMNALEPQVRALCGDALDPLVGSDGFDFVADLGAIVPMQVIGMLLGIPESDMRSVQSHGGERTKREPGKPADFARPTYNLADDAFFGDYIDWRSANPSDDLMTALLEVEFDDDTGATRRLTKEEILTFVNVLASAGNETTNRLISWSGKVLADHPDQRQELVEDPTLIGNAIEEVLRFEPPSIQSNRYVTTDIERYGETIPEGSIMMFLTGSANHDDRVFRDGDTFDIHRTIGHHVSFGYGIHFCLGAALARLEGRVALEEVLRRFPTWEVDSAAAALDSTAVRGWATLPVAVG